jgi:hypothetical protein
VLPLKPVLVLSEELLKIVKQQPIENCTLRMTLTVYPCHGSGDDSRNGPGFRESINTLLFIDLEES